MLTVRERERGRESTVRVAEVLCRVGVCASILSPRIASVFLVTRTQWPFG